MVLGIVLIVLGVLGLVFNQDISQRLSYTTREKVVDVGDLHVTADKEKPFPISAIAGGVALAGGIVAVVAAVKKG
jgi:hypothetical protein